MKVEYDEDKLLNAYIKAITEPLPEMKEVFDQESYEIKNCFPSDPSDPSYMNANVCEIGCGVGRPLIKMASDNLYFSFTGIDVSKKVLSYAKVASLYINNIDLEEQDMLNIKNHNNEFDLTYSTFNVVGSTDRENVPKLMKNKFKITKNKGYVLTMGWNDSDKTTEFLKKYYVSVGANIIEIDKTKTKTDLGTFLRYNENEIMSFYLDAGIRPVEVKNIGLWYAVAGQVKK